MRLSHLMVLGLFSMGITIASPLCGQSPPLEENQKAVLVFDIRLDLIRNSELAQSLGLEDQIAAMAAQQNDDGPDPTKIERVFGALSVPENMEAAQGFAAGELPIEFFVKLKFSDATTATELIEKIKGEGGPSFERDGKTYYQPPEDGKAPQGLLMHQVDAATVEVGTEAYVFHPGQQVFTAGLEEAWGKVPSNQAIRLALDVDGASGLLSEAVEFGKMGGNPMVAGYLDLVDNMKNLRISIDMSGDNLLMLQATGIDSENAEELRGGLDALLGIAKMTGGAQVTQLKEVDPESAAVAEALLKSLKATADETEVSVIVPKPAGFDAAVQQAVEKRIPPGN